jgi:hypothetical protein
MAAARMARWRGNGSGRRGERGIYWAARHWVTTADDEDAAVARPPRPAGTAWSMACARPGGHQGASGHGRVGKARPGAAGCLGRCRCLNLSTSMGGTRSKVEGGDRHDLEPEGTSEDTRHEIYTGSGSRSSYPTSCLE